MASQGKLFHAPQPNLPLCALRCINASTVSWTRRSSYTTPSISSASSGQARAPARCSVHARGDNRGYVRRGLGAETRITNLANAAATVGIRAPWDTVNYRAGDLGTTAAIRWRRAVERLMRHYSGHLKKAGLAVGIFITKGSRLRLSDLKLEVDKDGNFQAGPVTFSLAVDMWPHWLRIAIEQEARTEEARRQLEHLEEATEEHGQDHVLALDRELRPGMVAISAGAFTFDAFHASVRDRLRSQPQVGRRSSRPKLIAETLRRGFAIKPEPFANIRVAIIELFEFRDWSVHPPAGFLAPAVHPVMDVGVAAHYMRFRLENVRTVTRMTTQVLSQLSDVTRDGEPVVRDWAEETIRRELLELDLLREELGLGRLLNDEGKPKPPPN